VVNKPDEAVPVAPVGPLAVNIANLPATFFKLNERIMLTFAEGNDVMRVDCTVQEIRGYWIKCLGRARHGNGTVEQFNSWLNVNFVIRIN